MTYFRTYIAEKNGISLRKSLSLYSHSLPELLDFQHRSPRAGEDEIVGRGDTYIVFLGEAEELSDLGGALGTQALGVNDIGQAGDLLLALLDNGQSKDGQIHADDAAADGLSLALASSSGSVAGVAVGEEESDTGRVHDTLLHGETLLVVAASDLDDVALPLVTQAVGGDLSAHLLQSMSVLPSDT